MIFSRPVKGLHAGLAVLSLFFANLAVAQVGAPRASPEVQATALGWLEFRGQERSLPLSYTNEGALVALLPILETLGGKLTAGPLGQSHYLQILDTEFILGPESWVLTKGEDMISLSQPPVPSEEGLRVPVDLLQHTYGDLLGYDFRWRPRFRRLEVERRPPRLLPVVIDRLHSLGVTTLVLQFPVAPNYRIHRRQPDLLEVEIVGDRLQQRWPGGFTRDPLVRKVEVRSNRIQIWLQPQSVAADPYLLSEPYRLVFDISRRLAGPLQGPDRVPRGEGGIQTIVLDPGHGGSESGAIGPSGTEEKNLSLLLARALKARLERRFPVKVVLTRNEDSDLPLETRTALANQHKADLFVSLHLNSSLGSEAHGAETYFLSLQASDESAASSAAAENRSTGGGEAGNQKRSVGSAGSDDEDYGLQLILWDLAQSHHLAASQRLATLIQGELNETLKLRDRGVKQAPFRVLMGATMPAVLVELGFLSNPAEEGKLQDPAYRAQLVDALLRAILRYRQEVEQSPALGAR